MNNSILYAGAAMLILISAGFAAAMYLFASCRREIRTVRYVLTLKDGEVEDLSARISGQLKELNERVEMAEDRAGVLVPPPPPPSGLNLAKRSQAIRMLNRGAEPGVVAAALSLPRPEVVLLARIRKLAPPIPVPLTDPESL
ncbi:MAG TPA: hypothetical protein VFA04_12105 [Bryobacteraceae bacterium]|jgi:hypothetical protein|nr:hypothetical protein [Bryobacteraceae bacterium]